MVESGLLMLRFIFHYLQCAAQIKAVATDVVTKLAELLTLFNSRSCQLVLGAGAMHLVGLRSISAKHLVLAARSVGFFHSQIGVIKSVLLNILPTRQHVILNNNWDRIHNDYGNHQREIFSKLVTIMEELLDYSGGKIATADWTQPKSTLTNEIPFNTRPDGQTAELMKNTKTLRQCLLQNLTTTQCDEIFAQITTRFDSILSKHFAKIDISKQYIRLRLSYNVTHIIRRYRTIIGKDDVLKELEKYVYTEK